MPSCACWTGMRVTFASRSARALAVCGSRCCTKTYAIPSVAGRARNRSSMASNPPAEAPIPTTWEARLIDELDFVEIHVSLFFEHTCDGQMRAGIIHTRTDVSDSSQLVGYVRRRLHARALVLTRTKRHEKTIKAEPLEVYTIFLTMYSNQPPPATRPQTF